MLTEHGPWAVTLCAIECVLSGNIAVYDRDLLAFQSVFCIKRLVCCYKEVASEQYTIEINYDVYVTDYNFVTNGKMFQHQSQYTNKL